MDSKMSLISYELEVDGQQIQVKIQVKADEFLFNDAAVNLSFSFRTPSNS